MLLRREEWQQPITTTFVIYIYIYIDVVYTVLLMMND